MPFSVPHHDNLHALCPSDDVSPDAKQEAAKAARRRAQGRLLEQAFLAGDDSSALAVTNDPASASGVLPAAALDAEAAYAAELAAELQVRTLSLTLPGAEVCLYSTASSCLKRLEQIYMNLHQLSCRYCDTECLWDIVWQSDCRIGSDALIVMCAS